MGLAVPLEELLALTAGWILTSSGLYVRVSRVEASHELSALLGGSLRFLRDVIDCLGRICS